MCQFFSCVSDGKGKVYYFDAEMRRKIIAGETEYQDTDSHTSIAHGHGFRGRDEDKLNKYEYNPFTGRFRVDQLNTVDDSETVEEFCKALNWSTVVPDLVIKPVIHPFQDVQADAITERDVALLRAWASVGTSVRASVWASVGVSVGASAGDSVWDSVWDSVRTSVGDSVRDSVWASVGASAGDSVWDSVRTSVWASVWDSVWAYSSNFFLLEKWKYIDHEEGVNPFQSCIDLWENGFVPSFDGTTWRLHAGPKAEVVYEWTP